MLSIISVVEMSFEEMYIVKIFCLWFTAFSDKVTVRKQAKLNQNTSELNINARYRRTLC